MYINIIIHEYHKNVKVVAEKYGYQLNFCIDFKPLFMKMCF